MNEAPGTQQGRLCAILFLTKGGYLDGAQHRENIR